MPTVNQLVRSGRKSQGKKAKAPALLKGWNSKKREAIDQNSPQKRGVCTAVKTATVKVFIKSVIIFGIGYFESSSIFTNFCSAVMAGSFFRTFV